MHRFLVLLVLLAACGDNHDTHMNTPDAPPEEVDPCPPLELGTPRLQLNVFDEVTGVRYPIKGGDLAGSFLVVEMYDATTGGLPALATGTYDLASGVNTNLATCQHCAFIGKERDGGTSYEVQFFQAQGSMQLTKVTDPLEPVFAGVITAQLKAATANEMGTTSFVPDGACRRVDAVAFDTTPVPGACKTLDDCANEMLQVCDPIAQQCVEPQCDFDFGGCTETQACVPQLENAFYGACYEACDPSDANGCGEDFTCLQMSPYPDFGICMREGTASSGESCEPADASSGCVDELSCSRESNTCTAACDLFADGSPGCSTDTRCSYFGRCEPVTVADPVALGQACTSDAVLATACGTDAVGFQGFCFSYREEDPLQCIEACYDDGDCAGEQFCALRFSTGLGTCLPDPVCGDGELGEIGEVCDDGNTADSDTCSADCQTVDYGASCAAARPITASATLTGDTREGLDGFQASCQAGRARTELYEFTPATPGKLTVTVESTTSAAIAVLATCEAFPTELACRNQDHAESNTIVAQLGTTDPVTISVAGYTSIDEGPHTIRVDFVPESCGDSVIAGNEICDDGNTTANDGCSSDCYTIEYAAVCANAMPLSVSAPNTGDTTGAPPLYTNSCSGTATGGDRVYTFTAPTAGTLSLALDQGNADLALVVFDGCGAPAEITELDCSSVYGVEEAQVTLAAGQQVTVVVDGFNTDDAGPYTLTASFQ
jgi:cysteine-rich repeat protein